LEFEKWKGEFSVDDEGTLEEVQDSAEDLLANFVEYIKVILQYFPSFPLNKFFKIYSCKN